MRPLSLQCRLAVALATLLIAGAADAQCPPSTRRLLTDRRFDAARAEVQTALKANPNDGAALECMGFTYMEEDKSGPAVDWFEKAVKVDDNNAQHHLWLGNALGTEAEKANKLRQPFLARRCKTEFERAVALDPSLVDARVSLIQFYTLAPSIVGGSGEKADAQVREIAKLNPMRAHMEAAWIAQQRKDSVANERELQAALAAGPDSIAPYLQLGGLYAQQHRWDDAFATFEKLMQAKPDEPMAHFQYGRTAAISGKNLERGERELKFWLANMPASAPIPTQSGAHHRLGMIYEQLGNKDAARAEYQTAVSINGANEDAKKALARLK